MSAGAGVELRRRIDQSRRLPVLYLSGCPPEDLGDGAVLPADVLVVPKPFAPERLVSALRELLAPI